MVLVLFWRFQRKLVCLLLEQLLSVGLVDLLPVRGRDSVPTPLPELASTDLCCCCVFLGQNKFDLSGRYLVTYH